MSARTDSWTRELVELAALLLAVSAADLFAGPVAHVSSRVVVLGALAVLLLVSAVVHHRVRHRRRVPRDAQGTAVAWRVPATVRD